MLGEYFKEYFQACNSSLVYGEWGFIVYKIKNDSLYIHHLYMREYTGFKKFLTYIPSKNFRFIEGTISKDNPNCYRILENYVRYGCNFSEFENYFYVCKEVKRG